MTGGVPLFQETFTSWFPKSYGNPPVIIHLMFGSSMKSSIQLLRYPHDYGNIHMAWNHGKMVRWVKADVKPQRNILRHSKNDLTDTTWLMLIGDTIGSLYYLGDYDNPQGKLFTKWTPMGISVMLKIQCLKLKPSVQSHVLRVVINHPQMIGLRQRVYHIVGTSG